MEEKIKALLGEIGQAKVSNADEAEQFRLKYLSKKGIIPALFDEFWSHLLVEEDLLVAEDDPKENATHDYKPRCKKLQLIPTWPQVGQPNQN